LLVDVSPLYCTLPPYLGRHHRLFNIPIVPKLQRCPLPPTRIILAETHPTFVGVVRLILKETMATLMMVADEPSLAAALAGAQFDLVIADLSFPVSSGENVPRLLHRLNPNLKAILLSVHDERTVVDECIAAGVKGFVLKHAASTDLLAAVDAVLKGDTYISPAVSLKEKMQSENQ
jgi:two-component system, NarL family, nitrate/nitrite response regulator NarL